MTDHDETPAATGDGQIALDGLPLDEDAAVDELDPVALIDDHPLAALPPAPATAFAAVEEVLAGQVLHGFPVLRYGDSHLHTFRVPGSTVAFTLRSDVAPLLLAFAEWFNREIEPLRKGDCFGHAYRPVRGSTTTPSHHAAGIAIDCNSKKHPLGERDTFSHDDAARIHAKAKSLGLRWGGDYEHRADEMHVEIIVEHTRALDLVRRLQAPRKPKPVDPRIAALRKIPRELPPGLHPGGEHPSAKPLQELLVLAGFVSFRARDDHYGPLTKAGVRKFHHAHPGCKGQAGPTAITRAGWRELYRIAEQRILGSHR